MRRTSNLLRPRYKGVGAPMLLQAVTVLLVTSSFLGGCGQESSSTSGCVTPASDSFTRPFEVDEEDYPFRSCAFETSSGTIHYVDDGPRDASEVVLMVHGNPTWTFLYRNIAQAMIEDGHRVIMLDHLGMGMRYPFHGHVLGRWSRSW